MLNCRILQRGTRISGAIFSECMQYRYALWRVWNEQDGLVMFIGLNPSTADENQDDPTIRRCKRFAKDWGYGGLAMMNMFAFRATDPKRMKLQGDPVGPYNDRYLQEFHERAGKTIAAWGAHGSHDQRDQVIARLERTSPYAKTRYFGDDLWCLGTTAAGHPRHPLYLPKDAIPRRFRVKER